MPSTVSHLTPPIFHSTGNAPPIHSLPTELLLAIFTLVDEEEEYEGEHEGVMSMEDKRWQLGRVCHWWRIVVEGSPSLWTHLDVHLGKARMLRDPIALLHHALHLTKGQGLTLFLDCNMVPPGEDDDHPPANPDIVRDVFKILVAHAPSWRYVMITHFSMDIWYGLYALVADTTFAKLEALRIWDECSDHEDEDGEDSDDEYEMDDWVPNAPLLERLDLCRAPLNCGPLLPQLKQLSLLEIVYHVSLASLLQTSPRLEILDAHELSSSAEDSHSESDLLIEMPTRVMSSSLLHLSLSRNIEALCTVDLPNLRTLTTGDSESTTTPYLHSIFDLIQFSHPPLTRLALWNCDLAMGNLVGILKQIPLLQMFLITYGNIELDDEFNGNVDRALSSLTSALGDGDKETGGSILVPALEEFRIDFYKNDSAFKWTFYTPKVKADFETRQKRNGFMASCIFSSGEPYFGVKLSKCLCHIDS